MEKNAAKKEKKQHFNEIKKIWNYDTKSEPVSRNKAEKIMLSLASYISLITIITSFILYGMTTVISYETHQHLILIGLALYGYSVVNGIYRGDMVGGSVREIWFLALIIQIPYTLLYETYEPSPMFLLFITAVLVKYGIQYIGVVVLIMWGVTSHFSMKFSVYFSFLAFPLTFILFIKIADNYHKEIEVQKSQRKESNNKNTHFIKTPSMYLILLFIALIISHI